MDNLWFDHPDWQIVYLAPHTPEWEEERIRMLAAGGRDAVKFMDVQALKGNPWGVKRGPVAPRPLTARERMAARGLSVIDGGAQ